MTSQSVAVTSSTWIAVDPKRPRPPWMGAPLYPELQVVGRYHYALEELGVWHHPRQAKVGGDREVCKHLKKVGHLESFIGISDLQAIQESVPDDLDSYFPGQVLVGWKSAYSKRIYGIEFRFVPCLGFFQGYSQLYEFCLEQPLPLSHVGLFFH